MGITKWPLKLGILLAINAALISAGGGDDSSTLTSTTSTTPYNFNWDFLLSSSTSKNVLNFFNGFITFPTFAPFGPTVTESNCGFVDETGAWNTSKCFDNNDKGYAESGLWTEMKDNRTQMRKLRFRCRQQDFAVLNKCCKNPTGIFFDPGVLSSCYRRRGRVPLVNFANEYVLNLFQEPRINNSIDFNNPEIQASLSAGACFIQCLFGMAKMMNPNGTLDRQVLKQYLSSKISPYYKDIINVSVEVCRAKIAVFPVFALTNFATNNPTRCSMRPLLLLQCVRAHLIKYCPWKAFEQSEECLVLKKRLDVMCNVMDVLDLSTTPAPDLFWRKKK